jgi:uncharacterized Zn-binding protein involved in type VI secretion
MKKAIVIGGSTDHGGVVTVGHDTFKIDGKSVHLEGMTHFCPKCGITVTAISIGYAPPVNGKRIILVGDKTSCGATFIETVHDLFKVDRLSMGRSSATLGSGIEALLDQNSLSENLCFDEQIQVVDDNSNELLELMGYRLKVGGKQYEGVLDQEGKTERFQTEQAEEITDIEFFFTKEIVYFHELKQDI